MPTDPTIEAFLAVLKDRKRIEYDDPDLLMLADHLEESGHSDEAAYLRTHVKYIEWENDAPSTRSDNRGFKSGGWRSLLRLLGREDLP